MFVVTLPDTSEARFLRNRPWCSECKCGYSPRSVVNATAIRRTFKFPICINRFKANYFADNTIIYSQIPSESSHATFLARSPHYS